MDSVTVKLPSIKQLQYFLAVAQELNFRRAADRLRMTQPPLTRHIKSLEETLGCELFIRNTHEVRLTAAGMQLVEKATRLLEEFSKTVGEINKSPATLRIGLTRTLCFDNIPQVNNKIKKLVRDNESGMQNQISGQLLDALCKGHMDMVITGERELNSEAECHFRWIYREPLLIALPSDHPAGVQEPVALTDVADLPLFWFSRNTNPAFYDKCEAYFRKLSFTLKRLREPDDSLLMLSGIARGKGMALMPQSMCTFRQHGLCYRVLADEAAESLNIDVYVATRKNENRQSVLDGVASLTAESGSVEV